VDLERVGRGVGRVDQGARESRAQGADHGRASAGAERAAIHWLHEVLPLVPVTPHTQSASEGRP
jgi:hypothetical protein